MVSQILGKQDIDSLKNKTNKRREMILTYKRVTQKEYQRDQDEKWKKCNETKIGEGVKLG